MSATTRERILLKDVGKLFWIQAEELSTGLLRILNAQGLAEYELGNEPGVSLVKIDGCWPQKGEPFPGLVILQLDLEDPDDWEECKAVWFSQDIIHDIQEITPNKLPDWFGWELVRKTFPGWTQVKITEMAGQLRLPISGI